MSPMATTIEHYLDYLLIERGYSPATIKTYQTALNQQLVFFEDKAFKCWSELTNQEIKALLFHYRTKDLNARSMANKLSALRGLYDYLLQLKQVKHNPVKGVAAPKLAKPLPKHIDIDASQQLLAMDANTPLEIRDLAMMELFYATGIRLAELAQLNLEDVDFAEQFIQVMGKGSKQRVLPFGRVANKALKAWLEQRSSFVTSTAKQPALFLSQRGQRISQRNIQQRLKLAAQQQGLAERLNPHKLRHTFATHFLESSGDLRLVQELLGHENLSTTQVYTHLDFSHLTKTYDAAHPRAKRKKD